MSTALKLFVASGIPFALLAGAYYSTRYNLKTGIVAGLSGGIAVGLFLTLIVGFLHRRCVRKIAGQVADEDMHIHVVRQVELTLPFDRTFDLCVESLVCINGCRVIEEDRSRGIILAKTGINWKTWGDTITVRLKKLNHETTEITVSSRPTARTTLVDFGKNLENVLSILSCLKNNGRAS